MLDETPSLLDEAHAVVPPVTGVLSSLLPVLDYLRPYTPELAGLLSNLASASANYDANGHFLRVYVSSGSLLLGFGHRAAESGHHEEPGPPAR